MVFLAWIGFVGSWIVGIVGGAIIVSVFVGAVVSATTADVLADAFGSMLDQSVILSIITEIMTAAGALLLVAIIARIEGAGRRARRGDPRPARAGVPCCSFRGRLGARRRPAAGPGDERVAAVRAGDLRVAGLRARRGAACPAPPRADRSRRLPRRRLADRGPASRDLPRSLCSLCQPTLQSRRGPDSRCRLPRTGPTRSRRGVGLRDRALRSPPRPARTADARVLGDDAPRLDRGAAARRACRRPEPVPLRERRDAGAGPRAHRRGAARERRRAGTRPRC